MLTSVGASQMSSMARAGSIQSWEPELNRDVLLRGHIEDVYSERQDGGIGCRHVWDDGESLDRMKHKQQVTGKDRGQARGYQNHHHHHPTTQGSSGDG